MSGAMQQFALTLDKFLDHAAKWHPDAEVVTGRDGVVRRIGYADCRERSSKLSGALQGLGLGFGDRLATLAWNSQAHMECWYAAVGMGAIYHTLNPRLTSAHLASMIQRAGNRVLVVSQGLASLVEDLLGQCPSIEHVVVLDEPGAPDVAPISDRVRVWQQDELLATHGKPVVWGGFDEQADAGLCFTSGTTGAPKGVVYTHRSNYLLTLNMLQADVLGLTGQDSVLAAVPMFHANGWGLPFAAPAVGAKLVLPSRNADGASLAQLIADENVTVAAGVPTVWLGLVDHLEKVGGELPTLKRVLFGGSPVPQALLDRIEDRLNVTVQTSWGMTELSPLGTVTPANLPRRLAVNSGRPSVGLDLLLTDVDGAALPRQRGQEGHLKVRGHSAIERYFGEPDSATDADGWFDTGDLATLDAEGNLAITGRAKDLIKSGGEWINPSEIETVVGSLSGIALVATIGRAHPKWGERPILVIETRVGHAVTDEEISAALSSRVARWWMPDAIVRVSQMPLAITGKIDKVRLRAEHG